jgi:AAA+ ATPase superfamily predicted ATPase
MNEIIGRKKELSVLKSLLASKKSEFVAVYGSRRVV